MARSTREVSQKTRDTIVSSARQLFETRGFSDTTIAEICAAAKITKGALFHHFPSKDALFVEIWMDVQTKMDRTAAREALEHVKHTDDPYAGFLAGCRVYLDHASDPAFQRIVNIDGPAVLGAAEWSRRDAEMGLRNVGGGLRALVRQGLIDQADHKPLTILLYGALTNAGFILSRGNARATPDELLATFEKLLRSFARR